MKNAIIIHGRGGNSKENWFPWLKNELEKRKFNVFVPDLPNSNNPLLEEQLNYINKYSGYFEDGGYIISHSLGCQLTLNFIEKNNLKNLIIILVAPTYKGLALELGKDIFGKSFENINKYFNSDINFEKINKLNNNFYIFLSDNDPYINMKNAKKYYNNFINKKFIEFKNKGHFNKGSGTIELNEILDFIK